MPKNTNEQDIINQMDLILCIKKFESTVETCQRKITDIQSIPKKHHCVTALLLAEQAIKLSQSIFCLIKSNSYFSLPILLRSLLECAIQIEYIYKDPVINALSIELNDVIQQIAYLREVNAENIGLYEDRKTQLIALGANKVSTQDMLSYLGSKELFYPVFRVLSSFSHGKLTALSFQSITINEGEVLPELFKEFDEENIINFISLATQFLDGSVSKAIQLMDI